MLGVFLVTTLLSAVIYRVYRHFAALLDSVKNVPSQKTVPLIGDWNAIKNRNDIISYLYGMSKNTPITRTWLGHKLVVVLNDGELIKRVLAAPQLLQKPTFFYDVIGLPNGLICSPYDLWRVHRKIINPTFNPKILQSFIPIFEEKAEKLCFALVPNVGTGVEFDLLNEVLHCTMQTVFATTMGANGIQEADTKLAIRLFHLIVDFVGNRVLNPKLLLEWTYKLSKAFREELQVRRLMYEIVNSLIDHRKSVLKDTPGTAFGIDEPVKPQIFIDQLISKTIDKSSSVHMTNAEIEDECYSIVAAGSETTALTVSYTMLMLAMHPDIQAKATAEVDEFLASNPTLSADSLKSLPYMDTVIKETMRLLPTIPIIAREPMADLDLGVCTLKPSTIVCVNIFALHRNEQLWGENACEFRPDRFDANRLDKIDPTSYIPFSSGPRNCVGHRYASMSIKIMLIHLLKSYKFSTQLKLQDLKFYCTISLQLCNKHLVTIQRR